MKGSRICSSRPCHQWIGWGCFPLSDICDFSDNDPYRAIYLKILPRVGYCCGIPSDVFVFVVVWFVHWGMWETLGLWTRREHCKWGFVGHYRRIWEDSSAENNTYLEVQLRVTKGHNISNWARTHSCDVLAKNVVAFALVLSIYLRLNWRVFGLISLSEEISFNIDSVTGLLVISLT